MSKRTEKYHMYRLCVLSLLALVAMGLGVASCSPTLSYIRYRAKKFIEKTEIMEKVDFSEPNEYEFFTKKVEGLELVDYSEFILRIQTGLIDRNELRRKVLRFTEGLDGTIEVFDSNGIPVESIDVGHSKHLIRNDTIPLEYYVTGIKLGGVKGINANERCLIRIRITSGAPNLKGVPQIFNLSRRPIPYFERRALEAESKRSNSYRKGEP